MLEPDLLTLHQLSIGHSRDRAPLFTHITATLSKCKLIGLFGRNGIGKSTLLRTMDGLLPPIAGDVLLKGRKLQKWTPIDIATQIAFVPSLPQRTPRLSVIDMVGIGRYGFTNWIGAERKIDREIISKALDITALSHLAHRDSSTLSDGELQRASIARCLVQDTPLILLDEPTAFLDTGNKYKTVYLLKEITQTEQKGILFSTHDLTLALQVCDLLWIMDDNGFYAQPPAQLIQQGILDTLFQSYGLTFDCQTLSYRYAQIQ